MEKDKTQQTPVPPQKEDFSFLSTLPTLFHIDGGNEDSILEVIGNDMNQGPKYVKKIIKTNQKNFQYAKNQRTLMQIIKSDYVLKLLHWEERYGENNQIQSQRIPRFIILYMEYCAKGDLHSYLTQQDPSIGERINIFLDILYAMRFLHQKFISHRDLKLQNIFITEDNKIKIGDLGLSSQNFTITQTYAGTFGYMAPQITFNNIRAYSYQKADVWSIGFMGFQILNKPFQEDILNDRNIRDPFMKLQILRQRVREIESRGGDIDDYITLLSQRPLVFIKQIPNALKQLIKQMLVPNPSNRISFREIYEKEYLNRLQLQLLNYEQFGQDKVYEMGNLVTMIQDYAEIYYLIEFNKQKMLESQKNFNILYQNLYKKLIDLLTHAGKLMPVKDQETGKTCLLLFLTMRKLKAIYDTVKSSDFFMLKNKLKKKDNAVSNQYLTVKIQTEMYLKRNGQKPMDQNKEILSDKYFIQLVKEISTMHEFDAQEALAIWN